MQEEYRKKNYKSVIEQIEEWEREKAAKLAKKDELKGNYPFVTISREYGCGGYETANALAERLSEKGKKWVAFDRKVIEYLMEDMKISRKLAETLTTQMQSQMSSFFREVFANYPPQVAVHRRLAETIRMLALNGYVIIVGRGGNIITRDLPKGFHVRLVAPMEWKTARMARLTGKKLKEAEKLIIEKSAARESFYKEYLKFDPINPHHYDIVINNAKFSAPEAAKLIVASMKAKGFLEE
ncbi:MAG: cytidylate kinase-like family protein [Spirochaetes bacterium]|nr:cytidylate kinase-like family protein [Spirochaetota bacterium]